MAFADFRYYHGRPYDDGVPTTLGRTLASFGMGSNADTYRMPLNTEGGTFMATTDGICFTGTRQLFNMSCEITGCDASTGGVPSWSNGGNQYVNINQVQNHAMAKEIRKQWKDYAGCKDTVITHSVTDDGTGHLDMYFKVIDDNNETTVIRCWGVDPEKDIVQINRPYMAKLNYNRQWGFSTFSMRKMFKLLA